MKNTLDQELAHHDANAMVGDDVYYGRCAPGCTGINDAKWNVIRVKKIVVGGDDIYVKTYSQGNEIQDLKFADFADEAKMKYSHLKA